ncbi:MAG: methyltransferase [Mycolicibacterium sp.]
MTELVVLGQMVPQAVAAAVDLGVADALADGPLPPAELARRIGAEPDALKRLMRALISRGIFRKRRDGRYSLNALAEPLRSDSVRSVAGAARYFGLREHREAWSSLSDAVRTGRSVVPTLWGAEPFHYLEQHPEFAAIVNDAMSSISGMAAPVVVSAYDFGRFGVVVDVGGGQGRMLSAILSATPSAEGVLYELPRVAEGAHEIFEAAGVGDRVRIEGGSFFDSVPTGGDAYVLKDVIHDWDDTAAETILRNIAAAAHDGATLLLVELVIPRHDREFPGKWTDLEMLVLLGGRERDADEFRELLRRSGFHLQRIVPTATPFSIVEATPIKGNVTSPSA